MSRVVFYRPAQSKVGAARSYRVQLDGAPVCWVDHLGYNVVEVKPGQHLVQSDLRDVPGACSLKFDAIPGKTHYFELAPRKENLVAGLFGGVLGQAIEASNNSCGGAVSISERPAQTANSDLAPLRKSGE